MARDQSGRRGSSGARAEQFPAARDLEIKLGDASRGRGQELRFRWRVVERDDGTFRAFLEARLWSRSFNGWHPSRVGLRFRPEELDGLADAVAEARKHRDEFNDHGGAA